MPVQMFIIVKAGKERCIVMDVEVLMGDYLIPKPAC
jgi:hypothetical protein